MNENDFNTNLVDYIAASPTPFHAVSNMLDLLLDAGYVLLEESREWDIQGGKYCVCRNDSSLVAFSLPGEEFLADGVRMVGAHTDSPCLKLKPSPLVKASGYGQLGVEVYGGVLLNPWFDRDLSIAGRVTYRTGSGAIESCRIDFRRPIAVIPSLAIHLDRTANEQRSINAQTDIVPVLMLLGEQEQKNFDINVMLTQQMVAEHPGLDINRILGYELSLYDCQRPEITGLNSEFISGARLDNLVSCYVGLSALLDSGDTLPSLLVCYDHEEVGSGSFSGAQGPFLQSVLERLVQSSGQLTRLIDQSMMISCDNAHGIHPNFSHKHDGNHGPLLNKGPVLKMNANQRYSSNSETGAIFKNLCELADVPVQDFVMRSDMACGSTIGPITATEVGVKTVDVGVPQWGMHSIRETCGSKDPYYLYRVLKGFYASDP